MRGLNVSVNIGARLMPSLNSAATAVERRFRQMGQRLRVQAAETKVAWRETASAIKPIAALAAAGGLSMGLKGAFGAGTEYAHEIAMLKAAGRSTSDVAEAIAQANKTIQQLPTSTLIDNLKIINETTGAYGSFQHALENLTFNSKLGFMFTNMLGMDPSEISHALNAGVQALEVRGTAMDPAKYQREMSELFRAMVFTKGRFNADELKSFSQTGNIPIKGYNERFLTRVLPSLVTELGGGDIVGTQAAAFRNQIMGRVPLGGKKLTAEWVRLGLVPPNGTGGNLSKTGWTAGTVKGHGLAMADPFAWTEKVLLPAMQAKGVNTADPNAVLLQVSKMFGRETAMRFVATLADPRQRRRLHKDEKMIGQALPLDKSYELMLATDPRAAVASTMASIKNMETALGKAVTPDVIKGLNNLAKGINFLAGVFERHPNLAKGVLALMGFGAVAATLKLFDISLRLVARPLGLFVRLLSPLVGLGPIVLNVLARLGPWIIRGMMLAFGLLTTPVGWAIMAVIAVAMIWRFRKEIAGAWTNTVLPWLRNAGNTMKNYFLSINWSGVGMAIADALTFGLASKFAAGLAKLKPSVAALAGNTGMNSTRGGLTGARASGGPVRRGGLYLVGENGPELFRAGSSGHVFNHARTAAMLAGAAAAMTPTAAAAHVTVNVGDIVIQGAADPVATAREVRRELDRLAREQGAYLSD